MSERTVCRWLFGILIFLIVALGTFLIATAPAHGEGQEEAVSSNEGRMTRLDSYNTVATFLLEWRGREFLLNSQGGIIEVTR